MAGYFHSILSPNLVLLVYCNFKDSTRQTANNIIRSLLRQAIQQDGNMPNEIRVWFKDAMKYNSLPTLSEIKAVLFGKFRSTKNSAYIIIDGLDELQSQNREIITILRDELAESSTLRIMVTSRHGPGLVELSSNSPVINIDEHLDRTIDFRIFVSAKIANNKHLSRVIGSDSALRKEIDDWLIECSMGLYVLIRIKRC